MSSAARVVLQDIKHAIAAHANNLQSEEFRVSWFAIVGLLRAIGHVLEKIDAENSPAMRRAIKAKWEELNSNRPHPLIFWGFIEAERNRFLKNYEYGIHRTLTARHDSGSLISIVDVGKSQGGVLSSGAELQSRIADGPFEGQHEKHVAWQAYDWWVQYLDEVDLLANSYSKV
jgi:hypothetical protein